MVVIELDLVEEIMVFFIQSSEVIQSFLYIFEFFHLVDGGAKVRNLFALIWHQLCIAIELAHQLHDSTRAQVASV